MSEREPRGWLGALGATSAARPLQVWEGRWRVIPYDVLPDWLKDNDYLLHGHRPPMPSFRACFKSIFRIHTETGNIWTHLLGDGEGLAALGLEGCLVPVHRAALRGAGGPLRDQGLPARIRTPASSRARRQLGHEVPESSRSSVGEERPGRVLTAGPRCWARCRFVALPTLCKSKNRKASERFPLKRRDGQRLLALHLTMP